MDYKNKANPCIYRIGMDWLRKLREERGLSKYAAAKLVKVSPQMYFHYETKAKGAKLDFLLAVCDGYEISGDELIRRIREEVKAPKKESPKAT